MRLFAALMGLPAATILATAPVSAAMPGLLWLPICSGGATHWVAVPRDPGKPTRDDRPHSLCAHAQCPR
jgi:hypothetical protein